MSHVWYSHCISTRSFSYKSYNSEFLPGLFRAMALNPDVDINSDSEPELEDSRAVTVMPNHMISYTDSQARKIWLSNKVPKKLILLMFMLTQIGDPTQNPDGRLKVIEIFAGCHSITNAFKNVGYACATVDVSTVSPFDDINSSLGFIKALLYVMRLSDDGLFWAAPPCSTWVFMNRGTSKRSKVDPMGDTIKEICDQSE